MRLINVETLKLEKFIGKARPPYAVLSHTWGDDDDEISFRDIENGNIEKGSNRPTKLQGCCDQAKLDGFKYAWIDTCCIDKDSSRELDEAINSMFDWYKEAAICYSYLVDVPSDDNVWDPGSKFFSSRWFRRGWTLQELLAPKELQFFSQQWTFLGSRKDLSGVIQKITGIPRLVLRGTLGVHDASIAQRMSWAANRATTREEDTAYCLLGIFGIMMPMLYGEGRRAFLRLQEEIMKTASEDSFLAWGLEPAESSQTASAGVVSAGILASAPSDFTNCGHMVPPGPHATAAHTFTVSGGRLQVQLALHTAASGQHYGMLNCGPKDHPEQIVGLPINAAVSSGSSGEYIRPQGSHPVFLPRTISSSPAKVIHIRIKDQKPVHGTNSLRYGLLMDESMETNLELIDVYPRDRWQKDDAMITTAIDPEENTTQRSVARFRGRSDSEARDVIVALEVMIDGSDAQARCHVMTSSQDMDLTEFSKDFVHMPPRALGKQTARYGTRNIEVNVRQQLVGPQPMFVVKLTATANPPEVTVDAT